MSVFHPFKKGQGNLEASASLLGGKGAGLARAAAKGYPVPPGFTIDTTQCHAYMQSPAGTLSSLMEGVNLHCLGLRDQFGYMPLLSVRSGAPISMPGMMDTILNVGLTRKSLPLWKEKLGDRAAYDSYRRMLSMLGSTALGIDPKQFDLNVQATKEAFGVTDDHQMTAEAWQSVAKRHWTTYRNTLNMDPPDTIDAQLRLSIGAVFSSWNSERAIAYRDMEGIPHDMGTAVTVQSMVFGNMNDNSGSGVLFSRNPSTGDRVIMAEYLINAQGEDVVAGIRTPDHLELNSTEGYPEDWMASLHVLTHALETDYRDMVDVEFTVQDGELFLLQSRVGKRSARAAFKIAVDMVEEHVISRQEMYKRVSAKQYVAATRPAIEPSFKKAPDFVGLPASPGVVSGAVVFSAADAVEQSKTGPVILVTHETTPEDIKGMDAAIGVLTQTGGATSHAAVVARGMNKPCVTGATALQLPGSFAEGEMISIDGLTGGVWRGVVPTTSAEWDEAMTAFFKNLYLDNGLVRKVTLPAPDTCVTLTDWLDMEDAEITAAIERAQILDTEGHEVVYDATDPEAYGTEDDKIVWEIFGTVPEQEQFFRRVVHRLAKAGLTHAKVIAPNPTIAKMLIGGGLKPIPTISSLSELLDAQGLIKVDDKVSSVLDQEAISRLGTTGQVKATLFGRALSSEDAAFAVLGGA